MNTTTTLYQSKHATYREAVIAAKEQSERDLSNGFGIVEDLREHAFYVEENPGQLRNFERLHGEFLQGEYFPTEQ